MATAKKQPNILLIMADQMAGPALPMYRQSAVKAPHMQALADKGVVFDNAYCNFPICAPSRASLHAGVMPFRMDCFDNASEFRSDTPTLPYYLRAQGYKTQLCGKMHFVGPDQLHGYERRLTTDIYTANFATTVDWTKGGAFRPTNLTMAAVLESGPCLRTLQMDYDDEVEYNGIQGIYDLARADDGRPFFLTVSFTHPHSPFVIGQEYWDRYDFDDIDMPAAPDIPPEDRDLLSRNLYYCHTRHLFTVRDEHLRNARRAYYGMISYIDDKIGRLMKALNDTGLADNTLVIFTADHGEMMGERGMWYKQHFYEWASRVPLIAHWPKTFAPRRVHENVSLVDILPTLVDVASAGGNTVDYRAPLDGHSLTSLMSGNDATWSDTVVSEYSADGSTGPSVMIRRGPWKYMNIENVEDWLFNVEDDPLEQNNLAASPDCAAVLKELRAQVTERYDLDSLRAHIAENQQQRLFIHKTTDGVPPNIYMVRNDDDRRYVRGSRVADTKARARFPYVAPIQPDKDDEIKL